MIRVHRISLLMTEEQRRILESLAVALPPGLHRPGGGRPLVVFEIDEDHPSWEAVRQLVRGWGAGDRATARFSPEEVSAARWLELTPEWHHGYPQPRSGDFGYREATYELTDACEPCGNGMVQVAPFQMKREPKWGRRGILQLNWVFGEYFVKPDVWASVFQPRGSACRAVTNTKGVELQTVVQLVVEEEVSVSTGPLTPETCCTCGRTKYEPFTSDFFPALKGQPTRAMVRTVEWFGSGAAAWKNVLVSQELARAMTAFKLRGASFRPVASADDELD